ncbi:hypothetical protein CTT31_16270 [Pseudoalteromonas maricaloris]|uniref:hypothetical protein n=1 Tax=Pseudoalteromonas maricaloris TaxID=184924 RepID=UPI0021ADF4C9|nr:hypothetical protein [Pseudoalteromonas flavipulchra]USE70587.1 hypothetical protein CTT31_16270 [Pseudoalteromonas flavipulchra]
MSSNQTKQSARNIVIYIESYSRPGEGDKVEYIIDFCCYQDAQAVARLFGQELIPEVARFYRLTTPHMRHSRLAAGSFYSMPYTFFEEFELENEEFELEDGEGSAFVAYSLRTRSHFSFSQYLTDTQFISPSTPTLPFIKLEHQWNSLTVVNCGQGNWNEVHSSEYVLVYDFGASQRYSDRQVKDLISRRMRAMNGRRYTVIISHWDMDHFQALKFCSPTQLADCDAVFGPDNIPDTLVYRDTIEHLESNNVAIVCLRSTISRKGREITLSSIYSSATIDVYRASAGSSRNQTGIMLAIKGKNKVALLTGDHHYPKILDAVSTSSFSDRGVILVTPHHGGEAGYLSVSRWQTAFPNIECPISVGDNSYGHPQQNISRLQALEGKMPKLTVIANDNDIEYLL